MKIGILGCGRQADKHVAALKQIEGIEIVVADVVEELASQLATRMQVQAYPDTRTLLQDSSVEAVDICAPTRWHKELIVESLRAGKHVFCEKPLCRTLDEAMSVQSAAEDSGRVIMVGYHHRFHPAYQKVKEALDNKVIGQPYLALFRMGGRGSHREWKHRKEEGGGATFEILVHKLALISWFFGPITGAELLMKEVILPSRQIEQQIVQADAEDCIIVRLQCAGGLTIVCQSDLVTPGFMDHVEIQGENGSIFSSMLHYMPTNIFCSQPRGIYGAGDNISYFELHDLFKLELEHFLDMIRGRREPASTLEESMDIMRIIEGLSSSNGRSGLDKEVSLGR